MKIGQIVCHTQNDMKQHFKYLGKREICWRYQQALNGRGLIISTTLQVRRDRSRRRKPGCCGW